MAELVWNASERPYYDGVDRGVLYLPDLGAYAWSGLVSVTETSAANSRPIYFEGNLVGVVFDTEDFSAKVSAWTYPESFLKYTGYAIHEGTGSQYGSARFGSSRYSPKRLPGYFRKYFGMSYRTGNSKTGQIHLVYNAIARPTKESWATGTSDMSLFEWDLTTRPLRMSGVRPIAHLVVDIAETDPVAMAEIRSALYGTPATNPRLPTLSEMFNILHGEATFQVTDHEDGTWTVEGTEEAVVILPDGRVQISYPSVVPVDSTTYTISTEF